MTTSRDVLLALSSLLLALAVARSAMTAAPQDVRVLGREFVPVLATGLGTPPGPVNEKAIPAFHVAIAVVVGLRSQKQVFDVHTRRPITMMENVHSVWNWADKELPRETMCKDCAFSRSKRSIPVAFGTNPFPTAIRIGRQPHEAAPTLNERPTATPLCAIHIHSHPCDDPQGACR